MRLAKVAYVRALELKLVAQARRRHGSGAGCKPCSWRAHYKSDDACEAVVTRNLGDGHAECDDGISGELPLPAFPSLVFLNRLMSS